MEGCDCAECVGENPDTSFEENVESDNHSQDNTNSKPAKSCYACGGWDFWHNGGEWVCNRCHPNPTKLKRKHLPIDQPNNDTKNRNMGHTSTTKKEKEWQQSKTAPEHRRISPDGTPQNESIVTEEKRFVTENEPAAGPEPAPHGSTHSTGTPDTPEAKTASTEQSIDAAGAGALSQAQSTKKAPSKKGEGENGLIPVACLPSVEPHPNARKLSRKAKVDVLTMLAMNYTSRAIVVWLMQNHRVRVSRQNIDSYRNKHRSKICQTREILKKDIQKAVPTALKLNRIAIRDEMVQDLRRKPWKGRHEAINRILDSIKAEMEPLEVNLSVDLRAQTAQQYREVTDAGVIAEAMENLKAS